MESLKQDMIDIEINRRVVEEYIKTYNTFKTYIAESPTNLILIARKVIGYIIGLLKLIYKLLDKVFGKHNTNGGGGGSINTSASEDEKIKKGIDTILNVNKHIIDREIIEMLADINTREELELQRIDSAARMLDSMKKENTIKAYDIHINRLKTDDDYVDLWERVLELGMYDTCINTVYKNINSGLIKFWHTGVLAPAGFIDLSLLDNIEDIISDIQEDRDTDLARARGVLDGLIKELSKIVIDTKTIYDVAGDKIIAKPLQFVDITKYDNLEEDLKKSYKTTYVDLDEKICKDGLLETDPDKYHNIAADSFNKSAISMNGFKIEKQNKDISKSLLDLIRTYKSLNEDIEKVSLTPGKMDILIATMNIFITQHKLATIAYYYTIPHLKFRAKTIDVGAIMLILNSIVHSKEAINLRHKVELTKKK